MKNLKEEIRNTKGITLIALVITIIVLLILAGVSLSMILSQDGIFSRAERATDKYGQAKARETLELALGEAQYEKYNSLEYNENEYLDKFIEDEIPGVEVDGELVIVDGHIFEIDRNVPKILDYRGTADGVIITARVTGNNGWVKQGESVSITGVIKTYGKGATITSASATNIPDFSKDSLDENGRYEISGITTNTTITIDATDSIGDSDSKTIQVEIKRETIPPTITELKAEVVNDGMTIKFSASGHDKNDEGEEESGIDHFNYTITPTDGIPTERISGTFEVGESVEIISTLEKAYTIKVTATDNCGNTTTTPVSETITTKKIIYVTAINVDKTEGYLGIGGRENVIATIVPSNATNKEVEWISKNTNVAKVSQDGVIEGVSYGTTTVLVRSMDNPLIYTEISIKVGKEIDLHNLVMTRFAGESYGNVQKESTADGMHHLKFDLPVTGSHYYAYYSLVENPATGFYANVKVYSPNAYVAPGILPKGNTTPTYSANYRIGGSGGTNMPYYTGYREFSNQEDKCLIFYNSTSGSSNNLWVYKIILFYD